MGSGVGTVYLRGRRWEFMRRVPRRFQAFDPRGIVRIALRTDSEIEARAKAPAVAGELWAYWEALEAGNSAEALARYEATARLAQARGFPYRSVTDLVAGDVAEVVARISALVSRAGRIDTGTVADALLGAVPVSLPKLSEAFEDFFSLTTDRLAGKNAGQIRRWQEARKRTMTVVIEITGDKPLNEYSREDALRFRTHWSDLVTAGHAPNTANKQFGHMSDLFNTLTSLRNYEVTNHFGGLRLRDTGAAKRDPFSPEFIKSRILAPGALDGLNDEARDILLAMINTGAGPNEIIGLEQEDFRVDHEYPHIRIRPNALRALKTTTGDRAREIPAVGVSLDALRRLRDAGGCSRYLDKNDVWSAAVNAYMRKNGLRENPRQTAYSLRHSFEDRLLEAGVDDRIRADRMGHKYARPKYGAGGRLKSVSEAVALVSFEITVGTLAAAE